MRIEIKQRISGAVLWSGDAASVKVALTSAIKSGANLCDANLCGANLCGANLCGANLCDANLCGADLCGANLCGANLRDADLCGANLRDADLCGANLRDADLCGANLRDADLCGANLRDADLCGVKNADLAVARTLIVPEGSIIGWKKTADGIVKLRIPEEAKRSNASGRKCRAEFAVVLELPEGCNEARSLHDSTFIYCVGETVRSHEWCDNRWAECAGGIHFYLTKVEAEAH